MMKPMGNVVKLVFKKVDLPSVVTGKEMLADEQKWKKLL